jgi:triple functional domain protein
MTARILLVESVFLGSVDREIVRVESYIYVFCWQISPGFRESLADTTAEVGSTVVLRCVICGRPKPGIEWRGPRHLDLEAAQDITMTTGDDGSAELTVGGGACRDHAPLIHGLIMRADSGRKAASLWRIRLSD